MQGQKRRRLLTLIISSLSLLTLAACGSLSSNKTVVRFGVASSLREPVSKIIETYESQHPDIDIQMHAAASGILASEAKQGAEMDGILLASKQHMDQLITGGHVPNANQILGNRLVLIGHQENKYSSVNLKDFLSAADKIAVGNPKTTPIGTYTKDALSREDLYLLFKKKYLLSEDVIEIVNHVSTKKADLGISYVTDALLSDNVEILYEFPDQWHDDIRYYTAYLNQSELKSETEAFNTYLSSDESLRIFESYGFKIN